MVYYLTQSGAYSAWTPSVLVNYAVELIREIKALQEYQVAPKFDTPIKVPPKKVNV